MIWYDMTSISISISTIYNPQSTIHNLESLLNHPSIQKKNTGKPHPSSAPFSTYLYLPIFSESIFVLLVVLGTTNSGGDCNLNFSNSMIGRSSKSGWLKLDEMRVRKKERRFGVRICLCTLLRRPCIHQVAFFGWQMGMGRIYLDTLKDENSFHALP